MPEHFASILIEGGKKNSLGRANEVVEIVIRDKSRLEELYQCLSEDDAWLRMRTADSLEKVCREHPEWIEPYINRLFDDFSENTQPSIQWHLAQILAQVKLSEAQKQRAIKWLSQLLATVDVDWIVAANAMDTLAQFTRDESYDKQKFVRLLAIQQNHRSNSVKKRAAKLLTKFAS